MAALSIIQLVLTFLGALFKSQRQLALENLALRQQVAMLRKSVKRPRAKQTGKLFWIFFELADSTIDTHELLLRSLALLLLFEPAIEISEGTGLT